MNTQDPLLPWGAFQATNRFHRAIRQFDSTPIPEDEVRALLEEAAFAPSSGNLQPYKLHWIREPAVKVSVAPACNGQKAAGSAAELIVVVASPTLGKRTAETQLAHVEASSGLDLRTVRSGLYWRRECPFSGRSALRHHGNP